MTYRTLEGVACYYIVGMRLQKVMRDWTYDLRESDGDGEVNDVSECMLTPSDSNPSVLRCIEKLDDARQDMEKLGRALHRAMQHIDCMQGCRTFVPVMRDISLLASELGEVNSIRTWVYQKVMDAAGEING